jgi:hypothetical protein
VDDNMAVVVNVAHNSVPRDRLTVVAQDVLILDALFCERKKFLLVKVRTNSFFTLLILFLCLLDKREKLLPSVNFSFFFEGIDISTSLNHFSLCYGYIQ